MLCVTDEDTQRFEQGIYTCFTIVLDSILTLGIFVPVLLEVGTRAMPEGIDWPPWLLSIALGVHVCRLQARRSRG